jgi:outer membrane lipoprotein SlyB
MDQDRTHPILIAAGVAVLLVSLLGVAALTGTLPSATPKSSDPGVLAQSGAALQPKTPARPDGAQARPAQPRGAPAVPCATCGVIDAIRPIELQSDASGVGAFAGGVAGAVVGSQFGRGAGRALLTLGGAAGGAYAGNTIEKHLNKHAAWRVTVRLDDGSVRMLSQAAQPPFVVGDRVRIVNGSGLARA